jgi:beta-lactam-binding protein with PASTA domain
MRRSRPVRTWAIAAAVVVVVGLFAAFGMTTVPDVEGVESTAALEALTGAGLGEPHVDGWGTVVTRVFPGPGTPVLRGTRVQLVIGMPDGG